jgi:hypothetical protein
MDEKSKQNMEKHIPQYQAIMLQNIYACMIYNIAVELQKIDSNKHHEFKQYVIDAHKRVMETNGQLQEVLILDSLQLPTILQSDSLDKR